MPKKNTRLRPKNAFHEVARDALTLYRQQFLSIKAACYPDLVERGFSDEIETAFEERLKPYRSKIDQGKGLSLKEFFRNKLANIMEGAARKTEEAIDIHRLPRSKLCLDTIARSILEDCVNVVMLTNLQGDELIGYFCGQFQETIKHETYTVEEIGKFAQQYPMKFGVPEKRMPTTAGFEILRDCLEEFVKVHEIKKKNKYPPMTSGRIKKAWEFIEESFPREGNSTSPQIPNWFQALYRIYSSTLHGESVFGEMQTEGNDFVFHPAPEPSDERRVSGNREDSFEVLPSFLIALDHYGRFLGSRCEKKIENLWRRFVRPPSPQ